MKNRDIRASSVALVIANLIPLVGVLFLGWEPLTVFVIYVLESVIAGIFNVIKMLSVYFGNKEVALLKQPGDSGVAGLGLIPFFIVHYFFFVFIQCVLFFAFANIGADSFSPLRLIQNFKPYVYSDSGWAAGGIVLSYAINYALNFMLNGKFARTSLSQLFFRPYKRIFIQQFVVLFGGFVFILSSAVLPKAGLLVFVTIFTTIKIWFDLYFEEKVKGVGGNIKFD